MSQFSQHSSQQSSAPAAPIHQTPISPTLIHFAGSGIVLLLAAVLSQWRGRPHPKPAAVPAIQPERQQPLQWIGHAKRLERLGDHQAAVALYDQALQVHPADPRLWHERGLALAKLQQFEAALESYDRAYQIRPQQRDLAHERGDALLQLGRYSEAIDSFDIFLQYAPNNGHVLADRGYALMQLGCYQEALKSIELALSQRWEPGAQVRARRYQIEALRRSGRLEAALAAAQTAVKQHPEAEFGAQYIAIQRQLGRG